MEYSIINLITLHPSADLSCDDEIIKIEAKNFCGGTFGSYIRCGALSDTRYWTCGAKNFDIDLAAYDRTPSPADVIKHFCAFVGDSALVFNCEHDYRVLSCLPLPAALLRIKSRRS